MLMKHKTNLNGSNQCQLKLTYFLLNSYVLDILLLQHFKSVFIYSVFVSAMNVYNLTTY